MNHRLHLDKKILTKEQLLVKMNLWRFADQKIIFTNGVFDILHAGHVEYLSRAASLGNKLVIGLNSDASVQRIKGPDRPINPQNARLLLIAALEFVDAVTLFEEDTPYELIKLLVPDILIKGSDYNESEIVGADIVKASGGEVKTIELLEGFSSTKLIQKIRES